MILVNSINKAVLSVTTFYVVLELLYSIELLGLYCMHIDLRHKLLK